MRLHYSLGGLNVILFLFKTVKILPETEETQTFINNIQVE